MLVLAMVVTTIVETLHRLFGLREKGLALLLGNFYDRVHVVAYRRRPRRHAAARVVHRLDDRQSRPGRPGTDHRAGSRPSHRRPIGRPQVPQLDLERQTAGLAQPHRVHGTPRRQRVRRPSDERGERRGRQGRRVDAQGHRAEIRRVRPRGLRVLREPGPAAVGHRGVRAGLRHQRERPRDVRHVHAAAGRHAGRHRPGAERHRGLRAVAEGRQGARATGGHRAAGRRSRGAHTDPRRGRTPAARGRRTAHERSGGDGPGQDCGCDVEDGRSTGRVDSPGLDRLQGIALDDVARAVPGRPADWPRGAVLVPDRADAHWAARRGPRQGQGRAIRGDDAGATRGSEPAAEHANRRVPRGPGRRACSGQLQPTEEAVG